MLLFVWTTVIALAAAFAGWVLLAIWGVIEIWPSHSHPEADADEEITSTQDDKT